MKKLRAIILIAIIAMISVGVVGCDSDAKKNLNILPPSNDNTTPPSEPPCYTCDITPLDLSSVTTTNFGGGTVYVNGDMIEFTTGIPMGEYGQFGRQSGSVRIDRDIAAFQFGIVNQLQDNDWVVFSLTFGDDANNYMGSVLVCVRQENGQLYTGTVRGWQAAAPGANNGLPMMNDVNHKIASLNNIRVDFEDDYRQANLNGLNISTTVPANLATNFRSLFLARTNLEQVKIANIGVALKE